MVKEDRSAWKAKYITRLAQCFNEYPKMIVVTADNVGSRQMQKLRVSLREDAIIIMGKNSIMRKVIREQVSKNPQFERLLPNVYENVGFIFTKGDLRIIQSKIWENKIAAPARVGAIVPVDVTIQAQVTKLGPERTSFFQALQIPTKITRGTIEILNNINLIKAGDKVGASEASLLNMLNILPFSYGLVIRQIYDSDLTPIPPYTPIDILAKFIQGAKQLNAFSHGINCSSQTSAPVDIEEPYEIDSDDDDTIDFDIFS